MYRHRSSLRAAAYSGLLLSLAACTADTDSATNSIGATLTVAITDAAVDELASFEVEVTSLVLTTAGGSSVDVLREAVVVDLLTLADTSQVLNVLQLPPGIYTSAEVGFDFTDASAFLIDESSPASILNSDGVALTGSRFYPIEVGDALTTIRDRNRTLELDFDLNQSLTVDSDENEVTVEPAFVLRVDRSDPKQLFLPGTLGEISLSAQRFELELQSLSGGALGTVSVQVDDMTVFHIDGLDAIGSDGIDSLSSQSQGIWVQCYGAIDPNAARIDATYIEAGLGTYNGGSDIVEGHIVARAGGAGTNATLTVLGLSSDADHQNFLFNTEFTVLTSFSSTEVLRRESATDYDTDALNIGQRIRIFGSLGGVVMDARTDAVIRTLPTRVLGFANAGPADAELILTVDRIGLRDDELFQWEDGGSSPPDPEAFVAAIDDLGDGLGIEEDSPVIVRGFFTDVDASGADFSATALENRDDAASFLSIHDRTGGFTLTPTVAEESIELALAGEAATGERAIIDHGFVGSESLPQDPTPTIVPAGALGFFVIRDRDSGEISIHLSFEAFTTQLTTDLGAGAAIFNIGAVGANTASTNSMAATLVVVILD